MTVEDLTTASVVATPLSVTTNYVYGDATWPDKPTSITVDSAANPGGVRQRSVTYDGTTGQVLVDSVTGWIDTSHMETHTTTTALYNGTEAAAFNPGGPFNSSWLTLAQPTGLRKSIDGPRTDVNDVTTFVYYPFDSSVTTTWRGRLAAIRDALGHVTTYSDYDVFGNAQTIVDPNGVVVQSTFDTLGRFATVKYPAISGCDTSIDPTCNTDIISSRSYSPGGGSLATETKPRGGVSSYAYDSRGRVASITRTVSFTVSERIEYDYDPNTGRNSAERLLDNSSGSFLVKKSTSYSYDDEGRLTQALNPDNTKVLYTYDVAGALATVQDENHSAANTLYAYNEAGLLATVKQTLGTGQITTSYGYDVQGNLINVIDPNGNATTYTYDDFGRMLKQISPVTGTTTYVYDPSGNIITSIDANGATTNRAFDELNRVTGATSTRSGASDETVTWTYDDPTPGLYGIGHLTDLESSSSATYAYDRRGLLLSSSQDDLLTTFTYDADGNRDSIVYPSGRTVSYGYDLAGRPIYAAADGAPVVSSATYLPFGPRIQVGFGNGTTKSTTFDLRYRALENKLTLGVSIIADYAYADDAVGNITQIHDRTDSTYNRDFSYDDLKRLTVANSGASLWGNGSYTYDAMGNVTALHLGSRSLNFTYAGSTSQLQSVSGSNPETVTHDAAGNDTAEGPYTPRSLLSSVGTVGEGNENTWTQYAYDGRGVRIGAVRHDPSLSQPSGRGYVYSPELHLLAQTDWTSGNVLQGFFVGTDYVWLGDEPVAQLPANTAGDVSYTFTDHLGTPILQTGSDGSIAWRAEYEPFGKVYQYRVPDFSGRQTLRLPGQEEDGGLNYNITRWYRSDWGRYSQPDFLGLIGGTNLYQYVGDNPAGWADPWGLRPCRAQRALDLAAYDRLYRNWQSTGGGSTYGENHIAFASDLLNNLSYSATRGNRGSSCGGRAQSLANALSQYGSDCCRANTVDEWRLPILNSHLSPAPEHTFAIIECKCDSGDSEWQRVLEYRDTRADPERLWMTCERFSRNPPASPRFPHNNGGDGW